MKITSPITYGAAAVLLMTANPASAAVADGFTGFVNNVAATFSPTLLAQLIVVLIAIAGLYDAWHRHFLWTPVVIICSTFVMFSAWWVQTFYGVTVSAL